MEKEQEQTVLSAPFIYVRKGSKMRETVKQTLLGIELGRPLVAAVSGGVDSLVLLHLLIDLKDELGLRLSVCHVDHAMRHVSADDARYVKTLCQAWFVPCHTERVDVWERVRTSRESPEEAARNLRYDVLYRRARELGGAYIVLGHHAGDQAETVLLHLLRGSGMTGLGGMRIVNGDLVRPLLPFTKEAIEKYARAHGIVPCEDETNSDTAYLRNRVRHVLLPELSSYQPQIEEGLCRLATVMQADEDFLEQTTDEWWARIIRTESGRIIIGRASFREAPLAIRRRLVRKCVSALLGRDGGLSLVHCDRLCEMVAGSHAGSRCPIAREGHLTCTYDEAIFSCEETRGAVKLSERTLPLGRETVIDEVGIALRAELTNRIDKEDAVYFDADKVAFPLRVRSRRDGDMIATRGKIGKKKLKKELIDCKIAVSERDRIPLVCDADDTILWVVGIRTAHIACPDAKTKQYICLTSEKER